jgi:CPA2 family monovalent cation:H+ antiporter-2
VRGLGRIVWVAGPVQLGGTIALAMAVAVLAGYPLTKGILLGFIVSTCSTVILLKLLVDRGETDSPHGRFLVGINVFGDLMVVPMMLLVGPLAAGKQVGAAAILLAIFKAAATVIVTFVVARRVVPRFLAAMVRTRQKELFTVAVLLVIFGTALATSAAGLSLALGAFLAGLVVSESEFGHQAVADVAPFRDAFTALFFVSVGMLLDARILLRHPMLVSIVLALVFLGKGVLGGLPPLLLGYGARIAVVVGVSLAQIGEFSFVLLEETRRAGAIDRTGYQVILAATIISMVATPFLFEASHSIALRVAGGIGAPPSEREPRRADAHRLPAPAEGHVVILGFGHTGETLARVLSRARVPFRILDMHPERVARGKAAGLPIEFGDAANDRVLKHAGIERARAALVLLSDPRGSRRVVRLCRSLAPGLFILARTRYLTEVSELAPSAPTRSSRKSSRRRSRSRAGRFGGSVFRFPGWKPRRTRSAARATTLSAASTRRRRCPSSCARRSAERASRSSRSDRPGPLPGAPSRRWRCGRGAARVSSLSSGTESRRFPPPETSSSSAEIRCCSWATSRPSRGASRFSAARRQARPRD